MADNKEEPRPEYRWRCFSVVVSLLLMVAVVVIVYLVISIQEESKPPDLIKPQYGTVRLGEPPKPPVFHDLTATEIRGLVSYLTQEKSLNITRPPSYTVNTNYRYLAELYLPPKRDVLRHLDEGGPQPPREAIVTLFRGAEDPPDVIERIVGPLPNPTYMKPVPGRPISIPFILRPIDDIEFDKVAGFVKYELQTRLGKHLRAIYGGSLYNCGSECLMIDYLSYVSPTISGEQTRKFWLWLNRDKDNFMLHTLDFSVLVKTDNFNTVIEKIWFRGTTYKSIDDFKSRLFLNVTSTTLPDPHHDSSFSKTERRGVPFWDKPLRNPYQVEPDRRRYSVEHNHVTYMRWSFDFRMSSVHGPQIYDIRYDGQRVAYEIGLQELAVFYSGSSPTQMFGDFFDSFELLGSSASPLVPGIDCPPDATFIDASFLKSDSDQPSTTRNTFCVFELNTGEPYRRHNQVYPPTQTSYEGMESIILVFRTIITISNYDYVFDFRFFQNGGIHTRALSTGYITTSFYRPEEDPHGFRLHDFITGNIHQHLFHFKVDLDIMGTSNRFATLDIEPIWMNNIWSKNAGEKYQQTKFTHNVKNDEMSAAYKYDFSSPKYLTFYNNRSTNNYGIHRSYRVVPRGMSKQILAEGYGNEPSMSWSRYQMAVTRRKETELSSSSLYAALDTAEPVVKFQDFLDDNESIVDEDLVTWLTLGMHHIPHTEDLPVTPTPGMDIGFHLLPYNYFQEDQGTASRNALRIEPRDRRNPGSGVKVERYGVNQDITCSSTENSFWRDIERDPTLLFYYED